MEHNACIYQSTKNTCNFEGGGDGLTQLEFDYQLTGSANDNWSSFWLNAMAHGRWIQDAELDALEYMWGHLNHNWAGLPQDTHFKSSDMKNGHVTLKITTEGASATDCAYQSHTCADGGDWAKHWFSESTKALIRSGDLKHQFYIDFWDTKGNSSLQVENIKMQGGYKFKQQCSVAYGISSPF